MISQYFINAREQPLSESKQIPLPEKSKGQRCPFAFLSSRLLFHPRRLVISAAETAHGKNLIYLNSYNTGRMCLALILAGRHAFFACFCCHLGFTSFLAQFAQSDGVCSVFSGNKSSQKRSDLDR
jgi:hypothetical protein